MFQEIGAILRIPDFPKLRGEVSWTSKAVNFYYYVIDRTKLNEWLKT